ncbi:MAG: tetratricopeptide repeat protein [Candidatus Flexifilum sp.]
MIVPPVPQVGRRPRKLSAARRNELLRLPHPGERTDPFATDPQPFIRLYGRLALRRATASERVTDYLAIGDACARLTLGQENRLLIFYAGKALIAYRRAIAHADNPIERAFGESAVGQFVRWLCQAARAVPTRRNLAVALWAVGDQAGDGDPDAGAPTHAGGVDEQLVAELLDQFRRARDRQGEPLETRSEHRLEAEHTTLTSAEPPPGAVTRDADRTGVFALLTADENGAERAAASDDDDSDGWDESADRVDRTVDSGGRSGTDPEARIAHTELPTLEMPAFPEEIYLTAERPSAGHDLNVLLTQADEAPDRAPDGPGTADRPAPERASADSLIDLPPSRRALPRTPSDRDRAALAALSATQDVEAAGEYGEFERGQVIEGRFEVAAVRRGGMGVVYLCYDRVLRAPIALKTFQSKFLDNPRAIARFEQEALTWIQLEKHRHIVQARLVETIAGRPHILLEHISGPEGLDADLRSWIEHRRITPPLALEFALGIALGMQHAVQRVPGLVHRDLKPANILVTHDGIAKVTDFGLVRSVNSDDALLNSGFSLSGDEPADRLTRAGAIVGTAPYLSPEQCRSDSVDVRSDIYAFGCVLYEMLTGRHVFPARTFDEWLRAHQHEEARFPAESAAQLPAGVMALTLRCLEKQPAARPQSWGEIVDALAALYVEIHGQPPQMEIAGPALEARELMDKGYSLTELRRYAEAIEAYDEAIARKPDYAWAWARKARTLRLVNRLDEAMACYNEAIRLQPEYGWAWRGKGIIHDRRGEYQQALSCYQTAARYDPDEVWNWFNQADALLKLDQPDEALVCLQRALECDPAHPNSWAHLGQIYRQTGRYEEAVAAYRKAIELDPHYAWAFNGCGLALKMLGRLEEALAAFKNAARYDPGEFWHWYNLTEVLIDLRRGQEAIQPAEELTRLAPTSAIAWAKFGQVLRYARRLDEAMYAYRRAVEYDPDYAWAWNGLGIVYERLGRFEEALNAYRRTAAVSASGASGAISQAWLWYNQGNLLTVLGRYQEALPALRQAVEVDPDHVQSWARMGNVYRQMQQFDEAAAALERALTLDPRYVWAWNELGIVREQQERYPEALEAYRKAADLAPDDPAYIYSQADVLVTLGQYGGALDLLERSLRIDRGSAHTWAKHGQILRRLGRHEDALRSYARAVEIDPNYAWAWFGRGQTLLALNQIQNAIASFRRAAEIEPLDVWYAYNLGDALVQAEQFDEAVSVLELTTHLHPRHAETWAKLGQAYRRLERHHEAIRAYDRALAIQPDYAWAWFGRGSALEALERREEAVVSYERALEHDPNAIWYFMYLIDLLLKLNRKADADRVSERAVRQLPDNAIAWGRRGQVLRRLGDQGGAIASYQRAVALDPAYAWAWNGLGLAYLHSQQPDQALDAFQRATEHQPDNVWFWHNYGEAYLMLDRPDEALAQFERALALDPHHEPTRRKQLIARAMQQQTDDDTGDDL